MCSVVGVRWHCYPAFFAGPEAETPCFESQSPGIPDGRDGLRSHVRGADCSGEASSHNCRTGGRANRGRGEGLVKPCSLRCESIQVWGQSVLCTRPYAGIAAKVRVDVMCGNPDHIWGFHGLGDPVSSFVDPTVERNSCASGSPVLVIQAARVFLFVTSMGASAGSSARLFRHPGSMARL